MKLRKVGGGGGPLASAGEKWVLYGGPEPAEAKASQVAALLTQLTRPRAATEVLTAPNDAAFAGPEMKATVQGLGRRPGGPRQGRGGTSRRRSRSSRAPRSS